MADLSVEIAGIKFKNPFLVASCHAATPAGLRKAAKEGWGGGVISGGKHAGVGGGTTRGYIPREIPFVDKPPAFWGYENLSAAPEMARVGLSLQPKHIEDDLKELKDAGIPIGVNIFAASDLKAWVDTAVAAEKFGADFVEVNISCPYIPGIGMRLVAIWPEKLKPIVKAIKENCSLPVIVKLSAHPLPEALADLAREAVEGGADALSVSNALVGFVGVDIETGMPLALHMDVNGRLRGAAHGLSGPMIKPFVLRAVAELYQTVDVPIIGVGGVTSWESAVEYMMLGARAVEIGTGAMLYGWRVVRELIRGLEGFMERKGYKTVDDFIGMTAKRWGVGEPTTNVETKQPRTMFVDEVKCDGCGRCVVACDALAKGAIQIEDSIAVIDQALCEQCNSCLIVCPREAVSTQWHPGVLV